jgi:hypothetical protein
MCSPRRRLPTVISSGSTVLVFSHHVPQYDVLKLFPNSLQAFWNLVKIVTEEDRILMPTSFFTYQKVQYKFTLLTLLHCWLWTVFGGCCNVSSWRKNYVTYLCQRLNRAQGRSAGRIRPIEKSIDLIGIRTRDLPACSTLLRQSTIPRGPERP